MPAGSYLVVFAGEASFRVGSRALYIVCRTRVNGTLTSEVKAVVGDGVNATGSSVLTDILSVTRENPFDVTVNCLPDQSSAEPEAFPMIVWRRSSPRSAWTRWRPADPSRAVRR